MSIIFKIKVDEENIHDTEMDIKDTMLNLKQLIIKNMKLNVNYIDLNFLIDKPIRGFGKMNLEKGILPRTMDNYPFNKYNLEGKEILCEFIPVKDYKADLRGESNNSKGIYLVPGIKQMEDNKDYKPIFNLNLNSEEDFPSL